MTGLPQKCLGVAQPESWLESDRESAEEVKDEIDGKEPLQSHYKKRVKNKLKIAIKRLCLIAVIDFSLVIEKDMSSFVN